MLGWGQVMDLESMRLWALRVMGSLPLRCRCAFVVVGDSICVFPCDAAGRLDLRQTFVLRCAPPALAAPRASPRCCPACCPRRRRAASCCQPCRAPT
jgi:hypothetical protein